MKKLMLILITVLSLSGAAQVLRAQPVAAAAAQCFKRAAVGSSGASPIRNANCRAFQNPVQEKYGHPPQQDKCYLLAAGDVFEVTRNGRQCRQWRSTATSAPRSNAGDNGGNIKIGILDEAPSSGPGKQCGGGTDRVTVSINIGCRGRGNPIVDLLFAITRFLSIAVGILVVGSVILGGVQYIASAGKPDATAKAIGRIANSIIALLIYFLIFAILNWIVPSGLF